MMKQIRIIALLMFAGFVAACASTEPATPPPIETPPPSAPAPEAKSTSPIRTSEDIEREEMANARKRLLTETRVYFAFDSSSVDEQSRPVVEAHAANMTQNPNLSITLEGHGDERGTREYNLALGERRAQSVQKLMVAYGVSPKQIKVASFGEEKPVDAGHDESAWRQNRRVELVYKK
jgi:peptidoglycan-associated lipoprotein